MSPRIVVVKGIHHITCIAGNGAANVEYYTQILGLRLVKVSACLDDPMIVQTVYGDTAGTPGTLISFLHDPHPQAFGPQIPTRELGRGSAHVVILGVGSDEAVDFWAARLERARESERVCFEDPDGMKIEIVHLERGHGATSVSDGVIAKPYAIRGVAGVRILGDPNQAFLNAMGFIRQGTLWRSDEGGIIDYEPCDLPAGAGGAGSVHRVSWLADREDIVATSERLEDIGIRVTPLSNRHYFESVRFAEPSGVVFELSTPKPGFTVDEPIENLGTRLCLPPKYEALRRRIEDRVLALLPEIERA